MATLASYFGTAAEAVDGADPRPTRTKLHLPGADVWLHTDLWTPAERKAISVELEALDQWRARGILVRNRRCMQQRETAFYARKPGLNYRYSGIDNAEADPFPLVVERVYKTVEATLNRNFNYVLMNRYTDGTRSLGWHSDDERDLVSGSVIASVSFGAERFFDLRLKSDHTQKVRVPLPSGSMIVMGAGCQSLYDHCVPRQLRMNTQVDARAGLSAGAKAALKRRHNLTFRDVVQRRAP
jgi:alkylated DNA repair dioxygenase AlkB